MMSIKKNMELMEELHVPIAGLELAYVKIEGLRSRTTHLQYCDSMPDKGFSFQARGQFFYLATAAT